MKKQAIIHKSITVIMVLLLNTYAKNAGAQVLVDYSAFPSSSLGLQLGTEGFGAQYTSSFARSFNLRFGFNTIPGITFHYNNDRYLKVDRASVYAIADWQPLYGGTSWLQRKWFISAGMAYFPSFTNYRQGVRPTPDYSVTMSKIRPYVGMGLGNIYIKNNLGLRIDLGDYIPTSAPVTTFENKSVTITNGLKGIGPGLNAAATLYLKF